MKSTIGQNNETAMRKTEELHALKRYDLRMVLERVQSRNRRGTQRKVQSSDTMRKKLPPARAPRPPCS